MNKIAAKREIVNRMAITLREIDEIIRSEDFMMTTYPKMQDLSMGLCSIYLELKGDEG